MNYQSVSSSNIAAIGYDKNSSTLGIQFNNGGEYEYDNVPKSVFDAFLVASSHGRFFHANIKDVYGFRKIR